MALNYVKFGVVLTATFLMWILIGVSLSLAAGLVGLEPYRVFDNVVYSSFSMVILVVGVFYYFHRKIFKRDFLNRRDVSHLILIASTTFLPFFIYMTMVTLSAQLIHGRPVNLAVLSETLRLHFSVIVPVYFITLFLIGLVFAAIDWLVRFILTKARR